MSEHKAIIEKQGDSPYQQGFIAALKLYAHWHDGEQQVGSCGTMLWFAIQEALRIPDARPNSEALAHPPERKHTPLPFSSRGSDLYAAGQFLASFSAGGNTPHENRSNIRLVVLACNSHYKLLDAFKHMIGWFEHSEIAHTMTQMGEQADYHRTIREARAAIADAE